MNQQEWLELGIEEGFCSLPVCGTHDMAPMTSEEEAEFEAGGDPCIPMIRLLEATVKHLDPRMN